MLGGLDHLRHVCRTQALNLVDNLAAYHCRHVTRAQTPFPQLDPDEVVQKMLDWTNCAYGEYNFVEDGIPRPTELHPDMAWGMMVSCLLQHASIDLINGLPNRHDIKDPRRCPEEVLNLHVYDPLTDSQTILQALDVGAMLGMRDRPPCLNVVMTGFAKEFIRRNTLAEKPVSPTIMQYLHGMRLHSIRVDMNKMPAGDEWSAVWDIIRTKVKGEFHGCTMDYPDDSREFPVCTVWSYANKPKL